ncbi:MAG: ribosomal RNA small subunit methyltransferase A [Bacteroidetes bacterium]|nr:MAG: ribosomal RNA small subunit methyltransferase A [Bacteroidota bacterium]
MAKVTKKSFLQTDYRLKKSLGQHFLHDEGICKKIVAALEARPFQQLLEVGPGGGALTKHLLHLRDIDFKAVEIDEEKVAYLLRTYPQLQNRLLTADFLDIGPPFEGAFTVVGNFPYNISSQILFRLVDWQQQVEFAVGMFQKEVAQRVAAPPGSKTYGVISVLIQAYFKVAYLFDVPPESFTPPPKVMSGVISLTPLPAAQRFAVKSERHFKMLVKAAFNQRRKQLRNAVKPYFDAATLEDDIFTRRAEQLSVEDFARLSFLMQ